MKLYEDNKRLYEEYKLNSICKKKYVNSIYTSTIMHTPPPQQPPSLPTKSIKKRAPVRRTHQQTPQQKTDKQERMKIAREKKVLIKQKNLNHLENMRATKQIRDIEKQENKRKELEEQECTIINTYKKVKIELQDETLTMQHPTPFLCDSDITGNTDDNIVINLNNDDDNDDDYDYNSDATETDDEFIKPIDIDTYTQANQLLYFPSDPFPIEYTYVSDILFSSSNMHF